jgi:hypothetical protein
MIAIDTAEPERISIGAPYPAMSGTDHAKGA